MKGELSESRQRLPFSLGAVQLAMLMTNSQLFSASEKTRELEEMSPMNCAEYPVLKIARVGTVAFAGCLGN